MYQDLKQVISNLAPCASSFKGVLDDWVGKLEALGDASLRAEQAFEAKKALLDEQIASLNSQIQELKEARINLERDLRGLRKQLDHERREIDRVKAEARKLFEEIETT
jgi:chromosome segregation ATPase